jgi:fructose-bisphosphate aldolase class 1
MYKNPLNNGKISDYNSLKRQRNNATIINKYENKKIQTEPTELQKYYQYLTYQQPILDELNYVAERMRNEDIKTKTDNYNYIEDLKIKRENQMKENAKREEDIKKNRESLFDYSSTVKQDDMTPIINTDVKLETPSIIEQQQQEISQVDKLNLKSDLFNNDYFNLFDNDLSIADTIPIKKEIFELSREGEKKKKEKTPEELAEIEAKKAATKAQRAEKKKSKK